MITQSRAALANLSADPAPASVSVPVGPRAYPCVASPRRRCGAISRWDQFQALRVWSRVPHSCWFSKTPICRTSPLRPLSATATQTVALCTSNPTYVISFFPMQETLCRPSGTTLDIVHAERRAADHLANIGSRRGPWFHTTVTVDNPQCAVPLRSTKNIHAPDLDQARKKGRH